MSMSCTTTVDALRLRCIPRREQRSSSFRRDILKAAPVPHQRAMYRATRIEGGTEKPEDHVLLQPLHHDPFHGYAESPIPTIHFVGPYPLFQGTK